MNRIARRTLHLLAACHIDRIAYDPFVRDREARDPGVKRVDIFRGADLISLQTPDLEPLKYGITKETFAKTACARFPKAFGA